MARLLKVILVFHGLDLQEAEEKLEISRYTIEKYENDLKQIPLHVAATYRNRRKTPSLQRGDVEAVRCRFHPPLGMKH